MEHTVPASSGNKLVAYLRESRAELQKVVWPTKRETLMYTGLVIGISVAVALFIAAIDYLLTLGVEQILK